MRRRCQSGQRRCLLLPEEGEFLTYPLDGPADGSMRLGPLVNVLTPRAKRKEGMKRAFKKVFVAVGLLTIPISAGSAANWLSHPCSIEGKLPADSHRVSLPLKPDSEVLASQVGQAKEEEAGQIGQSQQPAAGAKEPVSTSPPQGVPDEKDRNAILDRVNRHPPLPGSSNEAGNQVPAGTESKPGK